MKLKNKYFILRHGETIYLTKKKNFTYPWPDEPAIKLTGKGERQIKAVAKKLKKQKPSTKTKFGARLVPHRNKVSGAGVDLIFSSDISRARQTAEIVAKKLRLKVNFDKRLRDINLGIYQNRPKKEFYQDFPYPEERFYRRPLRGESWLDCQKRMLSFLKDIDKKYKGKTILIVGHGNPLWLLEGAVKNWPRDKLLKIKINRDSIRASELHHL